METNKRWRRAAGEQQRGWKGERIYLAKCLSREAYERMVLTNRDLMSSFASGSLEICERVGEGQMVCANREGTGDKAREMRSGTGWKGEAEAVNKEGRSG